MKKSFTLIEVLVAIFLLSLLIASAMFAFKLFIKNSDAINVKLPEKAISFEWLNRSVSGIYPYILNNFDYFYKCDNDKLIYVTTTPVLYRHLSVAKIFRQNDKVIYEESPVYNRFQDYSHPEILEGNVTKKIILFSNIKKFKIICHKKVFLDYITLKINDNTFMFTPKSEWNDLNNTLKSIMEIQ